MTRSAEEFRAAALARGITWWPIRDCSICNAPIGYRLHPQRRSHDLPPEVAFDSACDCNQLDGLEPRTWDDVAAHYNLQRAPGVIAAYDRFWGFTGTDPAPAPAEPSPPSDPVAQLRELTEGAILLERIRVAGLAADLTWVLPPDVLPGVAELHGLPVVHAPVPGPLLAHWVRRWQG